MWNIFGASKPLLRASFLLGLGPFIVDKDPESLKVSSCGTAYTFIVIALFAACSVFGVRDKIQTAEKSFTYIGEYSSLVLLCCGIVVAVTSLLLTVIQGKKIAATVNNFHGIDGQMAKLDVHIPYNRIFRYSSLALIGLFVLLASLLCHDYLVTRRKTSVFFWITYFCPIVFSTFMQFQFISGGLLLKKNYSCLNERLTQFGKEKRLTEGDFRKIEFIDSNYGNYFESHFLRKSLDVPVRAWESSFSRYRSRKITPQDGVGHPTSLLIKIKIIRKIHSNLCETKELLNSSYSLQLLATVAQAFVIITTHLYALFTAGSKSEEKESISFPIIWACYRSMELICITVTCTKICKTANYTAVIVHKLLSEEWEPNIRNQLKLFSIQLLHRKISFSASGFFTLDMTLLHAIIGAATTYLVILVQFHNMYETS